MSATVQDNQGGVDLTPGLVRLFLATPKGLRATLRAVDSEGAELPATVWAYVAPSWVLDTRRPESERITIDVAGTDGRAFPPQTTVSLTVVSGGEDYRFDFPDLAGRTSRELVTFEFTDRVVTLSRARRGESGPTTTVLIDGSASMLSSELRPQVERVLDQLAGLSAGLETLNEEVPRWSVLRDGTRHETEAGQSRIELWDQPRSIGSVFGSDHFQRAGHYLVVTDEIPENVDGWAVADGARVQIVVVGEGILPGTRTLPEGIKVHLHRGSDDGTALAAAMAETFGWEK